MKYDFVLFENTRLVDNHYKDLENLAILLYKSGYNVAIANVFKEDVFCKDTRIPHITLEAKCPKGLCEAYREKNRLKEEWRQFRLARYLSSVVKEILAYTDNVYIGTLFSTLSVVECIKQFHKGQNCIIWGLRSSALKSKGGFKLTNIYSNIIKKRSLKYDNIKYIVSNELIQHEFVQLGISEGRIVCRPERTITELPEIKEKRESKSTLCLLSIGAIRTKKKVEHCLEALRILNDSSIQYIIAGKSNSEEKEKSIERSMEGLQNVERRNYRLEDTEYLNLIEQCDFMVLCDDNFKESISSGTMNEAVLNNKPVIASNCPTFNYFVEKYHLGLLYRWNDIQSLADAIEEAKNKGVDYFIGSIRDYQRLFLEENVVRSFKEDMAKMIR